MQMSPEIRREAIRIARPIVRDCIRAHNLRVCNYTVKQINDASLEVAKRTPKIIYEAWCNCKMHYEARKQVERGQ